MGGPSFLGIGPRRTGSSWLWTVLRAVPEVWLTPVKELRYWDEMWGVAGGGEVRRRLRSRRLRANLGAARGLLTRTGAAARFEPGFDRLLLAGRPDEAWYRALFDGAGGRPAGEITPSYFHLSPERIEALAAALPEVRVFLTLRDPLDRLWSATVKAVPGGLPAAQAAPPSELIGLGRPRLHSYGRGLEQWLAVLPRERVRVLWFDDLVARPAGYVAEVLDFVGAEADATAAVASVGGRVNASVGGAEEVPAPFASHFAPRILGDLERVDRILGATEPVARWRARLLAAAGDA